MSRANNSQAKFLDLLKSKEKSGSLISLEEILKSTGWKESTFLTYLNKGQLSEFLSETDNGKYSPSNSININYTDFYRRLSQSKHRQELGHHCKSKLAKALLKKSKDNMVLALELYNRPSLENRLDCFVLCFCVAWEQLLKAILIEENDENYIFDKKPKPNGIRGTISLRECLESLFEANDPIRKNIEIISFYRDQAVHLLMPEIQGTIYKVFQSGIINYGNKFQEFCNQSFISEESSGMLSLVGSLKNYTNSFIKEKYGNKIGEEIISIQNELIKQTEQENNIDFAIPINVKLAFAKNDSAGNLITLSKTEDGIEGLKEAIVIEKPTDRHNTHPFLQKEFLEQINRRLHDRYDKEVLEKCLVARDSKSKLPCVNQYDFQVIVNKLKWKKSSNKYHYLNENPELHYYSDAAIEEFITKIMTVKNYIKNARQNHKSK